MPDLKSLCTAVATTAVSAISSAISDCSDVGGIGAASVAPASGAPRLSLVVGSSSSLAHVAPGALAARNFSSTTSRLDNRSSALEAAMTSADSLAFAVSSSHHPAQCVRPSEKSENHRKRSFPMFPWGSTFLDRSILSRLCRRGSPANNMYVIGNAYWYIGDFILFYILLITSC